MKLMGALREDSRWTDFEGVFLERQIRIVKGEDSGSATVLSARRIPRPGGGSVKDCGPRALRYALERIGIRADVERLRELAETGKRGTSRSGLKKAAESCGIRAEGVQMDSRALRDLRNPAVAWWGGDHFVALLEVKGDSARIRDPNFMVDSEIKLDELVSKSGGIFLTLSK